jgi:hypothetical protein
MKLPTFRGAILAVSTLALAGVPGVAGAKDHPNKHPGKHQDQQEQRKDHDQSNDDGQQAKAQRQEDKQQEHQQRGEARQERQAARQEDGQHPRDRRIDAPRAQVQAQRQAYEAGLVQGRLSAERQQQLIQLQQARAREYSARLEQQQRLADQRTAALRQQNRMAQYRFQQAYVARLRQQQSHLSNLRSYDYSNDPYFYTAPSYRYSRAGRTYQTNRYGADLLRQAVGYGYEEGVRAGEADRQDGYRRGYQTSYAYEDANYGYTGMYVDRSDYNYYFRQGFQRGYQDGYNARSQYGRNMNGTSGILGDVLSAILNLQALR